MRDWGMQIKQAAEKITAGENGRRRKGLWRDGTDEAGKGGTAVARGVKKD